MISKKIVVLVVTGAIVIPGIVVANGWPIEFGLLTPKNAVDIERRVYSDDGKQQIDFTVKRPYPRFALDREQYESLHKNGWTECKTKRDEWFHYYDASTQASPEKRCRYTFSKKFIKGPNLLSVLQGRYSKHEGVKSCPATPDNDNIDVIILFEKYESLKQLRNALRIREISCN
jgi:hypothetical protein